MRKISTLFLLCIMIVCVTARAKPQNPVRTVFPQDINVRSRLADPPTTNKLLMVWLHQDDAFDPTSGKIMGALLNHHTVLTQKKFNVSQPGDGKFAGPHFDLIYDTNNSRYVIVYQNYKHGQTDIALTTIDHDGNYIDRAEELVEDVGLITGPIILSECPWNDQLIAFWPSYRDGEKFNHAVFFDPANPGVATSSVVTEESRDPYIMIPQAAVVRDSIIHLFTYSFNPNLNKLRFLSRVTFEQDRGFRDIKRIITSSARIQGSTTVSAISGEENFDGDIPIAFTSGNVNSPATIMEGGYFEPESEKIQERRAPIGSGPRTIDVELVASVDGNLDKLVWAEWNNGTYSINVADIDSSFRIVPGSKIEVVSSTSNAYSDISAVFVEEGARLIVSWSEHLDSEKTLVNAKAINY